MMENTKERFINFRPLVIIALMLCIGVVFMVEIYSNILMVIPAGVVAVVFALFCFIKKKYVFLAITMFIYLLGFGITVLTIETYSKSLSKEDCLIIGRVSDVVYSGYEGQYYLTFENVVIEVEDAKTSLSGKTSVTVYGVVNDDITVGDIISGKTKISNINIIEDNSVNINYYHDDIRYYCSLSFKNISIENNNPSVIEKLKTTTKDNLTKHMGEEVGGISYAVLFGDKSLIDYQTSTTFRESGISHILAVSGLHVGFLFAILYFFLNKLPLNRWLKFLALFIFLFGFCFVCEFSPSVVRASIMCLCLVLTRLLGKQYDGLSGISLAFIIIVLFRPLFIYDVGFQMSFGAVLGSILILKVIDRFDLKNKTLKNIVSGVSISIATQIGILPIIANSFGYLATYSVLINIVVIPIFAIFYPLLCIINLFVLISNVFSFLLVVPFALMKTIVAISSFVSSLPYAYIEVFGMGLISTILFYIAMFVLGGFVNLKGDIKTLSIIATLCLSVMFVTINNIPKKFTTNNFIVENNTYYASINTENNDLYLIDIDTSKKGIEKLRSILKGKKIKQIDGLIFISNTNFSSSEISNFAKDFDCVIYLPQNHASAPNLLLMGNDVVEYDDSKMLYFNFGTMQTFTYQKGLIAEFNINNKKFLISSGVFSEEDVLKIKNDILYPVHFVSYDENSYSLGDKQIFNSNYHLYYGEKCDIVI